MSISIHRPKNSCFYKKGKNNKENSFFSYFLAGIIDGDGHFSKIPQLVICFSLNDQSVAYFLKSKIGYGTVRKVKEKNAVTFVISHPKGLSIVKNLVAGKLQHLNKIEQYNTRLNSLPFFDLFKPQTNFCLKDNCWFSGFFLSDGSFQIKVLKREERKLPEVRCCIQVDQKTRHLLDLIKETFGGSIGFRSSQNTFYYSSVSFEGAFSVVKYFDRFPLMGSKQIQYVVWRKLLLFIQEKKHLTEEGVLWVINQKTKIEKIKKIKNAL